MYFLHPRQYILVIKPRIFNISIDPCSLNIALLLQTQSEQELERSNALGKGNSRFCCMGSRENYYRSVSQKNNNNPKF